MQAGFGWKVENTTVILFNQVSFHKDAICELVFSLVSCAANSPLNSVWLWAGSIEHQLSVGVHTSNTGGQPGGKVFQTQSSGNPAGKAGLEQKWSCASGQQDKAQQLFGEHGQTGSRHSLKDWQKSVFTTGRQQTGTREAEWEGISSGHV